MNLQDHFLKLANKMTSQIEYKLNPLISSQNPTRRRARIAASMRHKGERLQQIQSALFGLAKAAENGRVPEILAGIRHRTQVEMLLFHERLPSWGDSLASAHKLGIATDQRYQAARSALLSLTESREVDALQRQIKELEMELRIQKSPGFFVTPDEVVSTMIDLADIQQHHTILEPSAGLGNIADKLPKANLSVIEINYKRRHLLELKGHRIVGTDFLEHRGCYDRILMNPPFEKGQDIDHLYHAYDCLNVHGKLVAIMSAGPFFRQHHKDLKFRDWLCLNTAMVTDLPDKAFHQSGTGVATKLVEITKHGYGIM